MSTMLLSIKPKYAKVILQDKKGYEFRKKRCRNDITKIIFYSSSPQKQVVCEAEIDKIIEGSPTKIWEITKDAAGITQKAFYDYYQGRHTAVAYKLKNVVIYKEPRELSDYGISHAPQSYVYLD